jgi:alkanesulfonate monooxygenase SsuD/methylene tetrahydromethanopterin reductase-like flavin-dependent oxidoreductase (luciferase family)
MSLRIGFKTSPQHVDWTTLDETWDLAGELAVFEAAWLNDHLTDMDPATPGPSFEAMTLLAALAHHVRGKWLGHAVLSNTFRHPVLVAKAAIVLDHVSEGRFILGLGAGWYEGEHEPFGIPLPPIGERVDRLVSAVDTIRALFSPEAGQPGGVTREDPHYPLAGATNLPGPVRPWGPPIYLGGQRRRGIALAARAAQGWLLPGVNAGDVAYFSGRRDALLAAMAAAGRDPDGFAFVMQVATGSTAEDRAVALERARAAVEAGANEIVFQMPASAGPDGLAAVAHEVAEPLRDWALGRG